MADHGIDQQRYSVALRLSNFFERGDFRDAGCG